MTNMVSWLKSYTQRKKKLIQLVNQLTKSTQVKTKFMLKNIIHYNGDYKTTVML